MPTLEEQIAALNESLNSQQAPVLPTLPRGTPDDGTSPGLLGQIGSVLAGGQSPTYRLRGREADAAGGRALLNFGLNMLMASGPSRVKPDFLTAAATGLQGAQQSMDLDQRRAAAVAQQDYAQRMDLAKLGVEQNRDRIERMKAGLSLLQLQNRPVINADGSVSTAGTGGGGGGGGAAPGALQFTGDKEKDRLIIQQRESGGDPTALNYVAKADPTAYARGATAGGLYGFTNTTWAEGAKLAGVDTSKYPTARSAPKEEQDKVFDAVYDKRGTAPWDPSKWGQNWVKNASGGYDLVKTGTGTGGTSTPPPYKEATNRATTTTATDATQPPATTTTSTQPPPPATTPPAPAAAPPTTGPLAGLPTFDDFSKQNLAKPTPEEEALWRTPLAPEEEKNLRDGLKRLQSSVDAARASFNAPGSKEGEGTYQTAQKAYTDQENLLAQRQREALKVGDDRKAKWFEGERKRVENLYGELVKSNATLLTNREAVDNEDKKHTYQKLTEQTTAAGNRINALEGLRDLHRQVGSAGSTALLGNIKIPGTDLTALDIMTSTGWGSKEQLSKMSLVQAYNSAANLAVKEMKEGMAMGGMSDRDLTFIQNMIPRLSASPEMRELGISLLVSAQERARDMNVKIRGYMQGGMNSTEATARAQKEQPSLFPQVPQDKDTPAKRIEWMKDHVPAGHAFRHRDGKVDVYFDGDTAPAWWQGFK
jgi:hypothetical protein